MLMPVDAQRGNEDENDRQRAHKAGVAKVAAAAFSKSKEKNSDTASLQD
jgi:hypothetical protein